MVRLNHFGSISSEGIVKAAEAFGTPAYLYDERLLLDKCEKLLAMPNAFGHTVRYAMKANSSAAILRLIHGAGLRIDASSLNEAQRAHLAGIPYGDITLTTQEVPMGEGRQALNAMMAQGLKYNACSLRQLTLVGDFAAQQGCAVSLRVHPGIGAGESATRNTGDHYSCFGIHLTDIPQAISYAASKNIKIDQVHVHIGSGGDPATWRDNIDRELCILEQYFSDAHTISFGGGLKEARMPDETAADIDALGAYAKERLEAFHRRTGRKLHMEVEPGTYVTANVGYIVTRVMDKKQTGPEGMRFLVTDGGMEVNIRPLLYGSRHPFYVVSKEGRLLSSEFDAPGTHTYSAAVVGRCCESGDSQNMDANGLNQPRAMSEPELDDYLVIGGAGAYSPALSAFNYNSHVQAPEVLCTVEGELRLIRKRQSLEQVLENEC